MDRLRTLLTRCLSLFHQRDLDLDLEEELRTHIAFATEENIQRGMSPQQARTEALLTFGGLTQTKERYRTQRGLPMLETLSYDIRYALRQLRKSPGFTATVLLTLALGVGSVTAVFSVVQTVLLSPYTFRDPGQIVVWRESVRELEHVSLLLPDNYRHYLNLKSHATSIQDAAILQNSVFSISRPSDTTAHPEMTEGLAVSPNFFSLLGIEPLLGRTFTPDEAQPGKDHEILLTWGAWQRLFRADPSVLGKSLRVGSSLETIIGVLPKSFRFPVVSMMPGQVTHGSSERYEIYRPLVPMPNELTENEGEYNFLVVARLKPEVSTLQAQTELNGIEKATAVADHLATHPSVLVEPFAQEITGDYRKPLWLLFAAVLSILLMACVNLANLQIARGVARQQETSLRAALGASRSRLVQSVLVENLLLGLIGGLAGVALAFLGQRILLLTAATLPRLNEVHLSLPLLAFALGLSILTSLAFGILPALRALRAAPQNSLQANSTRHSASRQSARSRKLLVAVEVACSVTLLVITALITRSFSHLLTQDRQFAAEHVALAKADLSAARYSSLHPGMPDNPGADPGSLARDQMIDRTLDKLRTLPGVQSAALVSVLPLTGDVSVEMLHRPDHPLPASQTPLANRRFISPGYFATMSIPLLSGRDFTLQDRQNFASQASQSSPANQPSESNQSNQPDQPNQTVQKLQKVQSSGRVLILSERTAQAAFPGENPLGRTIRHWGYVYTVIGIAADARINDLKRNVAIFYLPYWDFPPNSPVFLVRTAPGIRTTIQPSTLRQTIWSVDPDISIPTVNSLDFQVSESVATERFQAVLLSSFGAAALLIAVLGIYGVLAYSVSLRTQEFGIRIALGSGRARLARLLLTDAAYPVLGGVAIGLLIAVLAARWVHSLLYETSAIDPLSITLSIAILLFASLLASLLPVHAATSVDPIQALRKE